MYQFKHHIYRIAEAVGTVILSVLLVDGSRFEDARVRFTGDAYTWIRLSILQQNVIMRLVLFDEVVL